MKKFILNIFDKARRFVLKIDEKINKIMEFLNRFNG